MHSLILGPSQLFKVARWKAGGPGSRNHVSFVRGHRSYIQKWLPGNFFDCILVVSSRSLETISALYIETVHSNFVKMTFGSLSIACLCGLSMPVYMSTLRTWVQLPGPPAFQRATLKSWDGPGDEAMTCTRGALTVMSSQSKYKATFNVFTG